jgi:hypothetical protein
MGLRRPIGKGLGVGMVSAVKIGSVSMTSLTESGSIGARKSSS